LSDANGSPSGRGVFFARVEARGFLRGVGFIGQSVFIVQIVGHVVVQKLRHQFLHVRALFKVISMGYRIDYGISKPAFHRNLHRHFRANSFLENQQLKNYTAIYTAIFSSQNFNRYFLSSLLPWSVKK
jgi:hypothetical protein